MLDLPQQENSNRENPMKSFKIEYVDGVLTVLETDGQSRMNEAVHGIHFEHVQGIGTQLTSNPVRSLMAGRGAYGDVDGAYVQMYMEEQVGTEHRLVLYADGFGRTDAWIFRAGGTISTGKGDVLTTGSDVRLKDAFMEPQEGACRRINSLGVCEFNMKGETRRRRGFIAQQAEKVDDLYTFLGIEQEIDGEKFRVMNVDYTAIIADLVTVVQDLIRRVDALES